jgi:polyhydroxybutyrate depolymerase
MVYKNIKVVKMKNNTIWKLNQVLCLILVLLGLYGCGSYESYTSASSIVGKTLTIDLDGEVYTWAFGEDGKARLSGGDAGDGVDAEYKQDGMDVIISLGQDEIAATYDGEKLELKEQSIDYESYSSPYGDDCVMHEGYYRCWDIYVPQGLKGSAPLVIDMHGASWNPSRQRAVSGFDSLADSEGFIVVWPYGMGKTWNSGTCCEPASEDNIDDVGFIRKLVTRVSGEYDIDMNRIYVTGLSNGCSMAQRLANEASDIIAAAACMSLYLLVPEDPGYRPVSVMTLIGTDDKDVGYEPGEYTFGALANFNTWKTMNNCTGSPVMTWSSGKSFASTYANCDNGTEVCLVTIDGGGHLLYKGQETDIDTSRLAWDFMKRFSK